MAEIKISALPPGVTPKLDGLVAGVQQGPPRKTVKQTIAQMRGVEAVALTTTPAVTNLDPVSSIYFVTTDGSAGETVINLTNPAAEFGGYNSTYLGTRITLFLVGLTDPADTVRVTLGGVDGGNILELVNPYLNLSSYSTVLLDFLGAAVSYVWTGYFYSIDVNGGGNNFDGLASYAPINFSQIFVGGGLQQISFDSVNGPTLINPTGTGEVQISPTGGRIIMATLPIADPGVPGALWNSAGTLKISP